MKRYPGPTSQEVTAIVDSGIAQIQATRLTTIETKLAEITKFLPPGRARDAAIEASAKIPPARIETNPEHQSMRLLMLNDNLHTLQAAVAHTAEFRRLVASMIDELQAFGQCFDRQLRLG